MRRSPRAFHFNGQDFTRIGIRAFVKEYHFLNFALLEGLCILGQRVIKEDPDELSLVGVAFQRSDFSQILVFVRTDVGSGQFGSWLSLVGIFPEAL